MTALDRLTVIVVVGDHCSENTCSGNNLLPRSDVYILDFVRRHLRIHSGHTLASSLIVGVCHKMLRRRSHLKVGLHTESHLYAQFAHKIGRLPIDLLVASPALVASHIQNRGIDICVAKKPALAPRDASHFADKFPVPTVPKPELGWEIGRPIGLHATYSLIRKVSRDAKARVLNEKPLHLVQGRSVGRSRPKIGTVHLNRHPPLAESVQMLVNGSNAVLPQLRLPLRGRERVCENATIAVESHHLTGFFLQSHLRKQVFHPRIDVRRLVFINILHPVFIEVYPAFMVDLSVLRPEFERCFGSK